MKPIKLLSQELAYTEYFLRDAIVHKYKLVMLDLHQKEKKLSKTDCVLIELLIDKSVILVTNNTLLKKATTQEAKERNVTVKIFDPLEL